MTASFSKNTVANGRVSHLLTTDHCIDIWQVNRKHKISNSDWKCRVNIKTQIWRRKEKLCFKSNTVKMNWTKICMGKRLQFQVDKVLVRSWLIKIKISKCSIIYLCSDWPVDSSIVRRVFETGSKEFDSDLPAKPILFPPSAWRFRFRGFFSGKTKFEKKNCSYIWHRLLFSVVATRSTFHRDLDHPT